MTSLLLLALAGAHLAWSHPLSRADAVAAQSRLAQLKAFVDGYHQAKFQNYTDQCSAASQDFRSQCSGRSDSSCQQHACSIAAHTNQQACTSSGGWWNSLNVPNSVCCSEGRVECKYDAAGQERSCCDPCLNSSDLNYGSMCTLDRGEGVSVCGTTQGSCGECSLPGRSDSQGTCEMAGYCSVHSSAMDQSSCTSAPNSGTWTPGVWSVSAATETSCEAPNYCGRCTSGGPTNEQRGQSGASLPTRLLCPMGQAWERISGVTNENSCNAQPNAARWLKLRRYDRGSELPAAPMTMMRCSTGPSHSEPSDMLARTCVDPAPFMQHAAAGMTAAGAVAAYGSYYDLVGRASYISNAIVTNHPNATERAKFSFTNEACMLLVVKAKNKGEINLLGSNRTHAVITDPTNYADADAITVVSGSATILGGTSAGPINAATDGRLEVWGVENSGPISASASKEVIIADTTNKAGALINASNVYATLIDVVNEGSVIANSVSFKAYRIVNTGSISIEASSVELELLCPPSCAGGSLTLGPSVTGSVTYAPGCRGSILMRGAGNQVQVQQAAAGQGGAACGPAPTPVPSSVPAPAVSVVAGSIPMQVADPQAFQSDTVKVSALKSAIASLSGGGITRDMVSLTFRTLRRLGAPAPRRLASMAVDYTISLPASLSVSSIAASLRSASAAAVTQAIDTELQRAGSSSASALGLSVSGPITASVTTGAPTPSAPMPGVAGGSPRRYGPGPMLALLGPLLALSGGCGDLPPPRPILG
mmetsp:Transcript_64784/g.200600  ORF Transcript_64784/g.200600 Transcript_64784/m.200600 type:complete len:764 (-) Transcript_64784:246-2537(-)